MLIRNTDAYLLIRDIATGNLSGGVDYPLPVGIGIQGAKNVQIENYTAYGSEVLRVLDSQNIKVRSYRGKNLFFEGARESTIENCTSDSIIIKGSMKTKSIFSRSFDVSRDLINASEHCIIRNCSQLGEIDLFDVRSCMIENCNFERSGLWLFNPSDVTFRNITAVNSSLWLNWARNISFENVTLVNPDISLAGSESKDFEIELKNSTVDGKPVYYYRNRSDLMLDKLDAGYIWLVNCTKSSIRGSKALGIFVMNSSNMILEDSVIDRSGIKLAFSQNCIIRNNLMLNATSDGGIIQYAGCHNNTVDRESATLGKSTMHSLP